MLSHDGPLAGGSVLPTGGGYTPTLTILANAYRVADQVVAAAKRREPT